MQSLNPIPNLTVILRIHWHDESDRDLCTLTHIDVLMPRSSSRCPGGDLISRYANRCKRSADKDRHTES